MKRGESLHELQDLDQELESGQRRVSEIQANLSETDALRQARQALTAAEEEHRRWMTRAQDLELEIESLSNKIDASESRLYGGAVTNPKELSDLQEELASLKRRCETLEDEFLETMVNSEEAEATLAKCRAALADEEDHWQADQAALKAELGKLEARLAKVQDERQQLHEIVAPADLRLYDKIRDRYGAPAVATMRDGVCSYCAVTPSSDKLKRIRAGRELLQCGNCKRILLDL